MNPSPLKSPLALARSPAAGSVCAGPAGSVCAKLTTVLTVSLLGVASIGMPSVMATVAVATTSPGCALLPATAIVALPPASTGPPVQATVVRSACGVAVQPGVGVATKEATPVNTTCSDRLATVSTGERLSIVNVQVTAWLITAGLGVAAALRARSVRPAASTTIVKVEEN